MPQGERPEYRHLLQVPSLADVTQPVAVTVIVPGQSAHHIATQRMAWMLVTLLSRSTTHVVSSITVNCPARALLQSLVTPHPARDGTLLSTLVDARVHGGPDAVPVVPALDSDYSKGAADLHLTYVINPSGTDGSLGSNEWALFASAWAGELTTDRPRLAPDPDAAAPFGAYVAAALAAAQVFLTARAHSYEPKPVMLDAWQWAVDPEQFVEPDVVEIEVDSVLAGVGAVGSACLLALWATEGVTGYVRAIDADERGIDVTNLNRCLPFTVADVDQPKAATAAAALTREGFVIGPEFGLGETYVDRTTHLISAVDTPEARQALQDCYPASAVQASTRDLRLEILRADPTNESACLRCYNPPKEVVPDDTLRGEAATASEGELQAHADSIGASIEAVKEWTKTGGCGELSDAMLTRLRASTGSRAEFSVGFMSVLAGTLLAARVVADSFARRDRAEATPSTPLNARFVLTLLDPAAVTNGRRAYPRDPSCPCCSKLRRTSWLSTFVG
jgi:hypothetical protein